MRKIDCAHSRSVKTLPWPWFREGGGCIEAKIEKFWNFSLKIIFLGGNFMRGIDCAHFRSVKMLPWPWFKEISTCWISFQYTLLFPWIRVKEAFSRFGNARNRFFAWFYPYIGQKSRKNFFGEWPPNGPPFKEPVYFREVDFMRKSVKLWTFFAFTPPTVDQSVQKVPASKILL